MHARVQDSMYVDRECVHRHFAHSQIHTVISPWKQETYPVKYDLPQISHMFVTKQLMKAVDAIDS